MAPEDQPENYNFHNYFVCFIDLLGQRTALEGEGLLPVIKSEDDRLRFIAKAKNSIGAIGSLQSRAAAIVGNDKATPDGAAFRAKLSPDHQRMWDEMLQAPLSQQRWSDGLVYFVNLGDQRVKCLVNGVYNLIALAGSLCVLGLSAKQPLRGAIDAAWAVELHPGEIYGAAVACAYELESKVAQWPRIVIGPRAIGYLTSHRELPDRDLFTQYNKSLAELCLRMLTRDVDGNAIVDYLGAEFQRSVTKGLRHELHRDALAFAREQAELHRSTGNEKLDSRYSNLVRYFEAHPPLESL